MLLSERELTAMAGFTGMEVCWLREKGFMCMPVSFLEALLGRFLFDINEFMLRWLLCCCNGPPLIAP